MRATAEAAYALTVTAIAACGFASGSTAIILVAVLLALPTSVAAIVAYYLAYGVLALVPGANPSSSSGSGWCTADGVCHETSSGELATWFSITTTVLGVLAITAAAVVNLVLLRLVVRRRRR